MKPLQNRDLALGLELPETLGNMQVSSRPEKEMRKVLLLMDREAIIPSDTATNVW